MSSTFDRVADWNFLCGKRPDFEIGSEKYWQALRDQIARIAEELQEVSEAVEKRDLENLLKEGCDLDVVVCGLNYLAGHDYGGAINEVLDNNDTKYTESFEEAWDAQDHYKRLGIECSLVMIDIDDKIAYYSVHRDKDDKVMKLLNHQKTDLSMFVRYN